MKQSAPVGSEPQQAKQPQPAADMAHAGNTPSFADNRPETIAQRKLMDTIRSSPKMIAQRNMVEMFHNSPRMIAQRTEPGYTKSPAPHMYDGMEYELLQGKLDAVQRIEEEEPMQGKFDAVQRIEDEKPLQGKFAIESPAQRERQPAVKPNNTGLPGNLKSGIESLSGLSMDSVRVHYNSSQPAQLNALAYAQGTDIHVAPGQEQHLPHEAWHVVQQAQGRVKPTMQMKDGVPINDDTGLEGEADLMGAKALGGGVMQKLGNENVQLKSLGLFSGVSVRVAQLSDVVALGVNDDEDLTQDKKIKTRNGSTSWFRFPKDGNKIDTFEENETTSTPKGAGHVDSTIDLDDDAKLHDYEIGTLSRARHFAAGDRLVGKVNNSYRKSKWTWHHKQDPYYMELVDMAVHKSFYHHGGFSKWQEGTDDDNDD